MANATTYPIEALSSAVRAIAGTLRQDRDDAIITLAEQHGGDWLGASPDLGPPRT